ncbi:MAG: aldo/keto reductase [Oscillospiraceae bacterium]|nr:aldo/keto reductase [Oscillospiraceae bacterium]
MEYRKLPHGNEHIGVLGLGMGGIQGSSDSEIEQVVRKAIENGINFFDLCGGGKNVYSPFGKAIQGSREKIYVQMHFGAVYNSKGEYGWSRKFDEIKKTVDWELNTLKTDYIDFGFLHCVDEEEDFDKLVSIGVFDYLKELKKQGVVRHIGFSSHTPSVANRILDTGEIDMMMFSINPAYDFEKGDEYGKGTVSERFSLLRRCEAEGVGISVMKPFFAGKLLSGSTSPFGTELSRYQCLQYALDRPGVLTAVPGVRNLADLDALIGFGDAPAEERDYSVIGTFSAEKIAGNCVYCNHCQPCPAGIDIGLVNKYYDLAQVGDKLAAGHYEKLSVKADACLSCGHCDSRCPFSVKQQDRMKEIAEYFGKNQ